MIDSGCSFHICCEKEKFSKLSYNDRGLVTLPNDESVKVEGIGEVVIVTHDGVKRRLSDVRYVPKLEKNLILLGRLESKECTFKASDGLLKVIKRKMVLMRGKRSDRNLYVPQVESGCLGHSDDGCKLPKKVTFDVDERYRLYGEIVVPSPKSQVTGEEFDHLIAHALSCSHESEDVSVMSYGGLKFGLLDEMIIVNGMVYFDNNKGMPKKGLLERSSSLARSSNATDSIQ